MAPRPSSQYARTPIPQLSQVSPNPPSSGICFAFLATTALGHLLLPGLRHWTTSFLVLSYPTSSGRYAIGFGDAGLVFSTVVLLTGLRAWFLSAVGKPLAGKLGVETPKDRTRFAEQAWMLTYYALMYPLELVRPLPLSLSHASGTY